MASFSPQEVADQTLDWATIRDGGIALYKNPEFLDGDTRDLAEKGYRVATLDCRVWSSLDAMHTSIAETLNFPDYYGHNLDALNECLCEDLDIPETGGLLIQLLAFDAIQTRSDALIHAGQTLLDIAARATREYMLTGKRLIVFIQTSDPNASYGNLGPVHAVWNRHEWLRSKRA